MARPLRVQIAGGFFHVTARGNRRQPIFFLSQHYGGLSLVKADTGPPEGPVDLYYADCTYTELTTLGLDCHRDLDIEEWFPAPGEISTQGRCTFTRTIRGVTSSRGACCTMPRPGRWRC